MKSLQIENSTYLLEIAKSQFSELQVLKSNAGWYIGTVFTDEDGFKEPGSRDSQYFLTKEIAQQALDNGDWEQRMTP